MSLFTGDQRRTGGRTWMDIDAQHDAHQERLLAEARGQRIANPAGWESTARWRLRKEYLRRHNREREALAKFVRGQRIGDPDIYGRQPVLHGEDYKAHLRRQARDLAARKRAEGIVRSGRDG